MKTIGVVLLLLFFGLSTGEKLKCYEGQCPNSEYCKGEVTECPEGSSCMTISEKSGFNHTYYSTKKRCSMNLECNSSMYAYVNADVYFDLAYDCCDNDLCNNGTNIMTNITYEFNGPECPACVSYDTLELCKPVTNTICRSKTDFCAYLVGRVKKPDGVETKFSVQGCMSNQSCNSDYSQAVGYRMKSISKYKCWLPKPKHQSKRKIRGILGYGTGN
ncbi:protein RoBo-1-like [Lithobates pipiens]